MEAAGLSITKLLRRCSALTEALERHRDCGDWKTTGQEVITAAQGTASPGRQSEFGLRFKKDLDGTFAAVNGIGPDLQNPDFASGLFGRLSDFGIRSRFRVDPGLFFARAFITDMGPQDALEAQLCAQMAVAHSWSMIFAHRLTHADDWLDMRSAERSLNSFLRTFCDQTEVFDRHRSQVTRRNVRQSSIAAARAIVRDIIPHSANSPSKVNGHAST